MSLVNVSSVLLSPKFRQTLTIRSTTGSRNEYGEWEDGTPTETTAKGSFQRVSERELAQLDFGDVKQEIRKLLTPTEINVSQNTDAQSDRIIWNGKRYRVLRVTDDSDNGFYRAFCAFEGVENGG